MKLKIVKNNNIITLNDNEKYDLKRDAGFDTMQVTFYDKSPNLLERWDRVELYETTELALPLEIEIGVGASVQYHTFTTDTITFNVTILGVVYAYRVRIVLENDVVRFHTVEATFTIDEIETTFPSNINVRNIRKSGNVIWTGNVVRGSGGEITTNLILGTPQLWRVAEVPSVKINYEASPDWLYIVNLIEPVAILKGVAMPAFAFTQSLANDKTLADAVEHALRNQNERTITNKENYKYKLSSSGASKLTMTAPDDTFDEQDLYSILKYYGEIIDAKPILVSDEIDFTYFNDYTTTITPNMTQIEVVRSIDEYATEVIEDAENVDTNEITVFPGIRAFTYQEDISETVLSFGLMSLTLPHNVKKIHTIEIVNSGFSYTLNYGSALFEETEWQSLAQSSFWGFLPLPRYNAFRDNTMYYKYGDNKVYNIKAIEQRRSPGDDALANSYRIRVTYEPLYNFQIKRKSNIILDGGDKFVERINQNAKTIRLVAEGERLKYELQNKQQVTYNVTFDTDTLPSIKNRINVLGQPLIITQMVAERIGNRWSIDASLSDGFNRKNKLTKALRENRLFEIPSGQTVIRKYIIEKDARVFINLSNVYEIGVTEDVVTSPSTGVYQNYGYFPFINYQGNASDFSGIKSGNLYAFVEWVYKTPFIDGDENEVTVIATMMPYSIIKDENTIIILMQMLNNTAVDYARQPGSLGIMNVQSAIVTDEFGENESIRIKYIPLTSDAELIYNTDEIFRTYPLVTDTFFQNGVATADDNFNVMHMSEIWYINKDRREQMQFEQRFNIVGAVGSVASEYLLSNSRFKLADEAVGYVYLTISGNEYKIQVNANYFNTYARFLVQIPVSGTLTAIAVGNNNNKVFAREGYIVNVEINEYRAIYITIRE